MNNILHIIVLSIIIRRCTTLEHFMKCSNVVTFEYLKNIFSQQLECHLVDLHVDNDNDYEHNWPKMECSTPGREISLVYNVVDATKECSTTNTTTTNNNDTTILCLKLYQLKQKWGPNAFDRNHHYPVLENFTDYDKFFIKNSVITFEQSIQAIGVKDVKLCRTLPKCNMTAADITTSQLNQTLDFVSMLDWNSTNCSLTSLKVYPQSTKTSPSHRHIPDVRHLYFYNYSMNMSLIFPKHWRNLEQLELASMVYINFRNTKQIAESLKYFRCHNCGLSELPTEIQELTNLKKLEFTVDDFFDNFTLRTSLLSNLTNLEEFSISGYHNLTFESSMPFPVLPNLKILNLQNSNLTYLPPGVFQHLRLVTTLRLDHNLIRELEGDIFSEFSNKTKIFVNNNLIAKVNLTNMFVNTLDLSNNQLKNMSRSFNISNLNLSFNQLENWDMLQLDGIEVMDLSHNNIRVVTQKMLKSLEHIQRLRLGGNPFDCKSCHLHSLQDLLHKNDKQKYLDLEDMKCHAPIGQIRCHILDVKVRSCSTIMFFYYGLSSLVCLLILISYIVIRYYLGNDFSYLWDVWQRSKSTEPRIEEKTLLYDAFLCYSSDDEGWVNELVKELEVPSFDDLLVKPAYRLYVHQRDLLGGDEILDKINECIEHSRRVIIVLSPNFMKHQWCKWELKFSQHKLFEGNSGNFMILVELEHLNRSTLPLSLRCIMNTKHSLKWPKKTTDLARANFWKKIRSSLGSPITVHNCTV